MGKTLKVISPVDEKVYIERPFAAAADIEQALTAAVKAQMSWRAVPVAERLPYIQEFIKAFKELAPRISEELSWQMGRPIIYGPNEVRGTVERATGMADLALSSLEIGRASCRERV